MRIRHRYAPLWFLLFCAFCVSQMSYGADFENNRSTRSVSTTSLVVIPNTNPGDILGRIIVSKKATAAETFSVYDSSGIESGLIAVIDVSTAAAGQYDFSLRISSAVTVTKSAGSADLTILWKKVR